MYVLASQRDSDAAEALRRYKDYVSSQRENFPPGAYALATSDWYFDATHHDCPHDGWLESVTLAEPSSGDRNEHRACSLTIELLGAYHDVKLRFHYQRVSGYQLGHGAVEKGHGDWRYDEFRLSERGTLLHEIEWRQYQHESRWLIEAEDVKFTAERINGAI